MKGDKTQKSWFIYVDSMDTDTARKAGRALGELGITGRFVSGRDPYALMQQIAAEQAAAKVPQNG